MQVWQRTAVAGFLLGGLLVAQGWAQSPAAAVVPTAPDAKALERFDTLVRPTAQALEIKDRSLTGPGASLLQARITLARFVIFGEEHGVRDIARLAQALVPTLKSSGFSHAAIEVDPWMAAKAEERLRAGGVAALAAWQAAGRSKAMPFLNLREEAELARDLLALRGGGGATLWGLDQVFIGAAPELLARIAATATNPAARDMAAGLQKEAAADFPFLGKVDPARLEALRDRLSTPTDASLRELAEALRLSATIYRPFVANEGSAFVANSVRERLMKVEFARNLERASDATGKPPRVFIKVGRNHGSGGISSTGVKALGGFLDAMATQVGAEVLSLGIVCGPGSRIALFSGETASCDEDFAASLELLRPYLSSTGITMFDLRPWKDQPRRWALLPREGAEIVRNYDMLIVVSGSPAAEFLR